MWGTVGQGAAGEDALDDGERLVQPAVDDQPARRLRQQEQRRCSAGDVVHVTDGPTPLFIMHMDAAGHLVIHTVLARCAPDMSSAGARGMATIQRHAPGSEDSPQSTSAAVSMPAHSST
jgi:hypothetical protein